ncbi:unnamed protein product [Bursaphelenchus xylophilus]|uniref:(pine wood nematode) hypothetical protein n=1 Tax=Bursaphelenchus xylophilus TaxID=6326 RepID=A0A7I8WRI5_BURXY|nr:unnamed protein product [Bursaphelenchus xylophilus]CAG9114562.1 unnamed protein product [Bursaphelenchus xylophilus]
MLHHQELVITLFWGESGFDKCRSDTLGGLRSAYLKQLVDHVDPANAHSDALGERLIVVQTSATTHEMKEPA